MTQGVKLGLRCVPDAKTNVIWICSISVSAERALPWQPSAPRKHGSQFDLIPE